MKRAVGILSIAVVPLFVAAVVGAADYPSRHTTHGSGTAGTSAHSGKGFTGQHTMTGRITDIDKTKGRLSVDAQGETLDLHFPSSAIQNMAKGDEVTVQLAIKEGAGPTHGSGSRMPSTPPSAGTR